MNDFILYNTCGDEEGFNYMVNFMSFRLIRLDNRPKDVCVNPGFDLITGELIE